jgi:uncharacterized protein YjiS (DUF1127 family)
VNAVSPLARAEKGILRPHAADRAERADQTIGQPRRFHGMLARLASSVASWPRRARIRQHLAALDDGMLRDLGLERSEVEAESTLSFWRQG